MNNVNAILKQRRKIFKKTYPRTSKAISLANKALKGIKYIQGMINCEKHKMEFSEATTTTILNTGTVYHLSGVVQDDTDSGRSGNSILARGLLFTYTLRNAASTPLSFTTVRVLVVQDQQQLSDAGPANITGVLEYTSGVRVVNSPLDSQTVGRWKVLYNRVHDMDTVNNPQVNIKKYIPMKKHIRYNGAGAGDIQKAGIYAFFICSDSSLSNPVIYQMSSRLYFYDN